MHRFCVVIAALLLQACPVATANEPQRVSTELQEVRWQVGPPGAISICIGPDGRAWHQMSANPEDMSEYQIRQRLQAEWRHPAPQVVGARLALFEPNGRVWFAFDLGKRLCGYDGKKWVQRSAHDNSRFVGTCPARGELFDNISNRHIRGKSYFLDQQGVHVFDGETWSHEPFYNVAATNSQLPRYSVSPDGKRAVAVHEQRGNRGTEGYQLWKMAEGVWQKVEFLRVEQTGVMGSFCVMNDGTLWYIADEVALQSLALGPAKKAAPSERIAGLIEQLGDDDFAVRVRATEDLMKEGPSIRAVIESALETAKDAETKLRLRHLVARLKEAAGSGVHREALSETMTTIADCRVQKVRGIRQDDNGVVYVFAESIEHGDRPAVKGMAIIPPDGPSRTYALDVVRRIRGDSVAPCIRLSSGEGIWLCAPLRLLDYRTGEELHWLPDPSFAQLRAVDEQGRVFVGHMERNFAMQASSGMAVFWPKFPDHRETLELALTAPVRSDHLVAKDGKVWAHRTGEGLSRLHGLVWEVVHADDFDEQAPLLAGQHDMVIARGRKGHLLFQDGKLLAEGALREIIQAHAKTIAKAFPPELTSPLPLMARLAITCDAAGNIWVRESQSAAILQGDRWTEMRPLLTAAGARSGAVQMVSAVGKGQLVFVSDAFDPRDGGKSFLAEIQEGSLKLTAAPHMHARFGGPSGLRDSSGALWVQSDIAGLRFNRFSGDGKVTPVSDIGTPALADAKEHVWLVRPRATQDHGIHIWKSGKVVQDLRIPQTLGVYGIYSDKPASVYVATMQGLHHYVANADDAVFHYKSVATYALPWPLVPHMKFNCTSAGTLVTEAGAKLPGDRSILVAKLPE